MQEEGLGGFLERSLDLFPDLPLVRGEDRFFNQGLIQFTQRVTPDLRFPQNDKFPFRQFLQVRQTATSFCVNPGNVHS